MSGCMIMGVSVDVEVMVVVLCCISLSRKAAKVRHGAALTRHTRITMK